MILGIYGKTGSGKSTVAEYLSKKGFYIIDCDKIGHDILKHGQIGYNKVVSAFGEGFFLDNMEIDRKKLGTYLFSHRDKLEILNNISFPLIEKKAKEEIEKNKDKNILIDGAHLYKTDIVNMCDAIILIKTNKSVERIIKRDNISETVAIDRLNAQENYEKCDYVIVNNDSVEELYICIDKIIQEEERKTQ